MKFHYSDLYTCAQYLDCPILVGDSTGFCQANYKCNTCDKCVSDSVSVDFCLKWCKPYVSGCEVPVPVHSECVQCPALKSFPGGLPRKPHLSISSSIATLSWCSSDAYTATSNNENARLDVNVTFYDIKSNAEIGTSFESHFISSLADPVSPSDPLICGDTSYFQYFVNIDVSLATSYTPVTATLNLGECC